MTIIFVFIIIFGQLLVCIGYSLKVFVLMIIGRMIFGIGGESVNICINTILTKWFQNSNLSFAQVLII